MIISALLFILSVFLFLFAPKVYSQNYCIILLLIFLLSSISIIRQAVTRRNFFNFHVLFLISFFFVNFVYPVFLYPSNPFYFSVFKFEFDHLIITRATALALLGVTSYGLGASLVVRKDFNQELSLSLNFKTLLLFQVVLAYLIFAIILFYAGSDMLKGYFGSTAHIPPGLLVIFQVIVGLSVIMVVLSRDVESSLFGFVRKINKPILILLFCYIGLFLYTGDRGPVLQISLIIISVFACFVRPIGLRRMIILVAAGMLLLTFVSYARTKNTSPREVGLTGFVNRGIKNTQLNSVFDMGMDLIVCNRNLYAGYEYVGEHGLNYGKNMFYYLFAPFPMIPSLMSHIFFDASPSDLTSAIILTREAKATYGLGTNLIIDLYMAFGVFGVVFFMFLLGFIVKKLQFKAENHNNIMHIIAYIFLVGFSVYLPRSALLEPLRHIIWAIFLYLLLKYFRLLLLQLSLKKDRNLAKADRVS